MVYNKKTKRMRMIKAGNENIKKIEKNEINYFVKQMKERAKEQTAWGRESEKEDRERENKKR